MEDEKIVQMLLARQESVLTELQRSHKARCLSVARNITENDADAEECWNDTCLAVWNSIPPVHPTSLRAYVTRIARNTALNLVKKRQTEKRSAVLVELDACVADSLPDWEASEIGALIDSFLEGIPRAEAAIFMRRYFASEGVKEIAASLGCTENRISKILAKLRRKLKRHLTERGTLL